MHPLLIVLLVIAGIQVGVLVIGLVFVIGKKAYHKVKKVPEYNAYEQEYGRQPCPNVLQKTIPPKPDQE